MAGLFSLGEVRETTTSRNNNNNNQLDQQHQHTTTDLLSAANEISPDQSWFLYRSNDHHHRHDHNVAYRGFELWQETPQHDQRQHPQAHNSITTNDHIHHQHPFPFQDLYSSAAATGTVLDMGPNNRNSFNIFEDDRSSRFFMMSSRSTSGGGIGVGGVSCQDCGNQAKKDCVHKRCRTCCKSRGFQCQTHVKSTWVPAAKRREKLLLLQQQQQQQHQTQAHQYPKMHRDINITTAGTAGSSLLSPRLPTTNPTGLEEGIFPAEMNTTAVFRCVHVSSMDEAGEDQYAYQTAVNIGGHLFKGVLYDQGPADHHHHSSQHCALTGADTSSTEHNLITAAMTTTRNSTASAVGSPAPAFFDPSLNYPAPLTTFTSGMQFFPHQTP